ncbi:MAG: cytochrome c [Flaviaesturariibacter sp.]|nr:cytochrome c [Flaviaesturariibacter sp.]
MKRVKKIVKWTGITLLLLLLILTGAVAVNQNKKFNAPYPDIKASLDSSIISRGKHLVFSSAHCASCHSSSNSDSLLELGIEPSLSGGFRFELEIGNIYARNITADKETGIGNLTDAEIARTLYYGVGSDGRAMFDFMPFHNVSESDMQAIISYLRTQKPVKNKVPPNAYNTMGKIVKAFLLKPTGPSGSIAKTIAPDTSAQYGRYLVNSVGNCSGCHTQRDAMTGAFIGAHLAGGNEFDEKGTKFITPNLTTDSSSRLFGWSYENFKNRFKMGKLVANTPMPWNSYKRMTDDELKAIYNYLKTVKPAKLPAIK